MSKHGYCTKHVDKNEFTSSPREESAISDTMILADTSFARFPRKPTIRHKKPLTSRSCRSGFATRWQSWSSLFGSVFLCRIDMFPGSYNCPNIAQILSRISCLLRWVPHGCQERAAICLNCLLMPSWPPAGGAPVERMLRDSARSARCFCSMPLAFVAGWNML